MSSIPQGETEAQRVAEMSGGHTVVRVAGPVELSLSQERQETQHPSTE